MLVVEGVRQAVANPTVAGGVGAAVQVGSTMIRSPGMAKSIADWIVLNVVGGEAATPDATTCTGALPPIVTVTVSIDCLAFEGPVVAVLAVVIVN
jgi:hypothetical protein